MTGGEIAAIIGASGGVITVLTVLATWLYERRERRRQAAAAAEKCEAEADSIAGGTWEKALQTLEHTFNCRVDDLIKQVDELKTEQSNMRRQISQFERLLQRAYGRIEYLMAGIRKLLDQIKALDATAAPEWTPTDWLPDEEQK